MPTINQPDGSISFSAIATRLGKNSSSGGISLSNYYRGGARTPNVAGNSAVPTSGEIKVSDLSSAVRSKNEYLIKPWGFTSNFENSVTNDGNWSSPHFPGFVAGLNRNLGNSRVRATINTLTFANGGTTGLTQIFGGQQIDQGRSFSTFGFFGGANFLGRQNSQHTFTFDTATNTILPPTTTLGTTTFSTTTGLTASTDPSGGTTPIGSGDNNDGVWNIQLPWTYRMGSVEYTYVNVSTNSTVSFTTSPGGIAFDPTYYGWSQDGAVISGADNSCQRIYYGSTGTAPNRIYKIIWEGTNALTGTLGAPNIKWELQLYENTGVTTGTIARILIGTNARGSVVDLPNYNGDNFNGTWELTLPFNIEFLGRTSLDKIFVHSKSYMEFRRSLFTGEYWDDRLGGSPSGATGDGFNSREINGNLVSRFQASMPKFGVGILPFDNNPYNNLRVLSPDINNYTMSCERVWAGSSGTTPNRQYRIRWEGTVQSTVFATNPTSVGVPGSPNLTWEARFYENDPDRIDVHLVTNTIKVAGFPNLKVLIFDELGKNVPSGANPSAVGNLTYYDVGGQLGATTETGSVITTSNGRTITIGTGIRYIPEPFNALSSGYTLTESYKSIATSAASVLAINNLGELYYWGMDPRIDLTNGSTDRYTILEDYKKYTEDTALLQNYKLNPVRIGTDSDWKKVIPAGTRAGGFMLLKNDGTVYVLGHINDSRLVGNSSYTNKGIGVTTQFRSVPGVKDYSIGSALTYVAPVFSSLKNVTLTKDYYTNGSFWKLFLDFTVTFGNALPTNIIRITSFNNTSNIPEVHIMVSDEVMTFTNFEARELYMTSAGTAPNRTVDLTLLMQDSLALSSIYGIRSTNATTDSVVFVVNGLTQTISVNDSFTVNTSIGGMVVGVRYWIRTVAAPVADTSGYYFVTCTVSTSPGGAAFNVTTTESFDPYASYLNDWIRGCVRIRLGETIASNVIAEFHIVTMGKNTRDYYGDNTLYFSKLITDLDSTPTVSGTLFGTDNDPNQFAASSIYSVTRSTLDTGLNNNSAFRLVRNTAAADIGWNMDRRIHFNSPTRLFNGFAGGFKDITFTAESKYPNYGATFRSDQAGYGFIGHAFYGIGLDGNLYAAGEFKYNTNTVDTPTYTSPIALNRSQSGWNPISLEGGPSVRGSGADWEYIDGCDGVWTGIKTNGQLHSWGNEWTRGYRYTSGSFKGPTTTTIRSAYYFGALARGDAPAGSAVMNEDTASSTSVKFVKALNRRRVGVGLSVDGGVYTWGSTQSDGLNSTTDSRSRLGTYFNAADNSNNRRSTPRPLWSDISVVSASSGTFTFNWVTGRERLTISTGAPIIFFSSFNNAVTPLQVYYVSSWTPTATGGTFRISNTRQGATLSMSFTQGTIDPQLVTARAGLLRCMDIWSDGDAYHALDQDARTVYSWGVRGYVTGSFSTTSMLTDASNLSSIYPPEDGTVASHFNQSMKHYFLRI